MGRIVDDAYHATLGDLIEKRGLSYAQVREVCRRVMEAIEIA